MCIAKMGTKHFAIVKLPYDDEFSCSDYVEVKNGLDKCMFL